MRRHQRPEPEVRTRCAARAVANFGFKGALSQSVASVPLIPKFASEGAARICELRNRDTSSAMKSIFIDCNNQLAPVFARVGRSDDPPIAVNTERFQSADLPRLLAGYDLCLDDHSYLPTEAMAECRALKHIVFLGTGASSYMDVPALNSLGITVHTIKGYGDTAVAEHAIALLFACCRELARMDRGVRAGVWDPLESVQLKGKTLGLIGLGGIGAEVARIARGIDMEVIAWNRSPRPQAGVPMVGLDELLALADVISLHLALTEETRGV